ncbi:hypothetical protein ACU61A_11885 [Pseudonocardia sichuanensis]
MISHRTSRRLERWGLSGAGPLACSATAWLARELTRRRSTSVAGPLVRIAAGAPGPSAGRALAALDRMSADPEVFGEIAFQCLLQSGGPHSDQSARVWSSVAAPLLLAPTPPGRHVPHVRLIAFLDAGPEPAGGRGVRERLVSSLVVGVSSDSPRREDLQDLLSTTDHPLILDALAAPWRRPHFLPDPLAAEAAVANPHLVPRERDDVLLAVAKGRLDLIDDEHAGTADALVRGTGLTGTGLAERYRRSLRRLGPGAARERVCELAQRRSYPDHVEPLAAAIDAGYLPADERKRVVFLYRTEQWERYESADPDGQLLYEIWLESHRSHDWYLHNLSDVISEAARRAGRADPLDRYLATRPVRDTDPDGPRPARHRPIGGISGAWGDSGSVHT